MQKHEFKLCIKNQPRCLRLCVAPWKSKPDGHTTSFVLKMTHFIVLGHLDPDEILTLIQKDDLFP